MRYTLNVPAIIESFGGPLTLRRKLAVLEGLDATPEREQMKKWAQRGNIPTHWLLVLAKLAESERRQLLLTDFVVESTDAAADAEA